MKIYLTPPQPSRGLQRIADALVKYKPEWVEVVSTQAEAELVVIYTIGRCNQLSQQVDYLLSTNRKYALIQICLRSTQKPDTRDWIPLWKDAAVLWSYYDLFKAALEDGVYIQGMDNFYHAPLGVESEVFQSPFRSSRWGAMPHQGRNFVIATSGSSYLSESVRECWLAAQAVGGQVFHVGMPIHRLRQLEKTFSSGGSDRELALHYAASRFVSALRRKEGFELPAAEGLLCGARPVAFDTPDYRWIYKNWAEYIQETDRQGVVDQLVKLFRQGARPVTQDEINEVRQWFHWPTIVGGFYERIRQS